MMKTLKTFLIIIMFLISNLSLSQWTYKITKLKNVKYSKIAYTETNNGGYLLMNMSKVDNIKEPFLVLCGKYFCDDFAFIDFVLVVNNINKKYKLKVNKSNDGKLMYFENTIWTKDFIFDFKNASKCFIRVNQENCSKNYYEFNMTKSSDAYNFIKK